MVGHPSVQHDIVPLGFFLLCVPHMEQLYARTGMRVEGLLFEGVWGYWEWRLACLLYHFGAFCSRGAVGGAPLEGL